MLVTSNKNPTNSPTAESHLLKFHLISSTSRNQHAHHQTLLLKISPQSHYKHHLTPVPNVETSPSAHYRVPHLSSQLGHLSTNSPRVSSNADYHQPITDIPSGPISQFKKLQNTSTHFFPYNTDTSLAVTMPCISSLPRFTFALTFSCPKPLLSRRFRPRSVLNRV